MKTINKRLSRKIVFCRFFCFQEKKIVAQKIKILTSNTKRSVSENLVKTMEKQQSRTIS